MRLLLAEDEKALAKALKAILERSNYSVDAVYDGEAALEYMAAGNYDEIILDIMMPKKDGLTVLKEIRKKGSKIPVLLLTAKGEVDDKVEGLDAGANDYLTKPFHAKELLARLRAMTRVQMESEVGAVLLVAFPEVLRSFALYRFVVYGLILLVMMRFRSQGLLGSLSDRP